MSIEFQKVSGFQRGTLLKLLKDAYSFDSRYEQSWIADWEAMDSFFFDNPAIADEYGLITTLKGEAIGFVVWDPRNLPESAELGHNCIASIHKGKGYSKLQLQETFNRIICKGAKTILVTTNDDLIPAQRMYESAGFTLVQKRKNEDIAGFPCEHLDYIFHT
ncbi:GNAT family N-acetyltransferase [Paenibacillus sp. MMS20-IR301]|uniref:GNAT family N-acetyltransferase n=1 Tax=Paenibacillus sp. MMS20-IR301 TaxID=2895946 RepID=UPI0028E5DF13|nr:GNAT family N-acetyltransferase [Paenibacillus sp. MMS20-IR301]WNS45970.1 GNAT family N-acetyltransferase [Paenibacillus sp. MMS20-IR301]